MSRPKTVIDWRKVDQLLKAQCVGTVIADVLGISPTTLYRAVKRTFKVDFDAYSHQKRAVGKELLRTKQFDTAMSGNVPMQIWLGKQYLGQKDKHDLGFDKDSSLSVKIDLTKYSDEELRIIAELQSKSGISQA